MCVCTKLFHLNVGRRQHSVPPSFSTSTSNKVQFNLLFERRTFSCIQVTGEDAYQGGGYDVAITKAFEDGYMEAKTEEYVEDDTEVNYMESIFPHKHPQIGDKWGSPK